MVFSKRFPRPAEGSVYPKWVDVSLSGEEEKNVEHLAREENVKLFAECIDDARKIVADKNLKPYQTDLISIAVALFDKRASHSIYHKERKAKDKFDSSGKK